MTTLLRTAVRNSQVSSPTSRLGLRTSTTPIHHGSASTSSRQLLRRPSQRLLSSQSKPPPRPHESEPEMVPKINIKEMFQGAPKPVKWVVIGGLTIVGTMETIFYIKWIHRWWTGGEKEVEGAAEAS